MLKFIKMKYRDACLLYYSVLFFFQREANESCNLIGS